MDRKLMEKIALVCTICLCTLTIWFDFGAERLLNYLLLHKITPIAYRDFGYLSILVPMGIILVMVTTVLYLCYHSDYPEEDGE